MSTYLKHVEIMKFYATKMYDISFDSPFKKLVYPESSNLVSITIFKKLTKFIEKSSKMMIEAIVYSSIYELRN